MLVIEQIDTPAVKPLKKVSITRRLVIVVEQIDVVATLLTPSGEQWLAMLARRHRSTSVRLTAIGMPQQLLISDDIAPMMATRVVDTQQHLAVAREHGQGFQNLRRHRRNAKHHHAPRQTIRGLRCFTQVCDKALVNTSAAALKSTLTNIRQHFTP
ncbi:hypothetical protein D3C85_932750 [compost metagenome]